MILDQIDCRARTFVNHLRDPDEGAIFYEEADDILEGFESKILELHSNAHSIERRPLRGHSNKVDLTYFGEDQHSPSLVVFKPSSERLFQVSDEFSVSLRSPTWSLWFHSGSCGAEPSHDLKLFKARKSNYRLFQFDCCEDEELTSDLDEALQRINELGAREAGWNGENSVAPSAKTASDAKTFISTLSGEIVAPPYISLANDGEINFYWKNQNVTIDLGFYGNGTYSYFAETSTKEYIEDAVEVSQALPKEILDLLRKPE